MSSVCRAPRKRRKRRNGVEPELECTPTRSKALVRPLCQPSALVPRNGARWPTPAGVPYGSNPARGKVSLSGLAAARVKARCPERAVWHETGARPAFYLTDIVRITENGRYAR
jgi:hypothetical protein